MNPKMHDSNAFSISKRNSENIKFNQDHNQISRKIALNNKKFCEHEWEIRFTIVALEHQEARGGGDRR